MSSNRFATPPRVCTSEGKPRRLGLELEFAGLDMPAVAQILADLYQGEALPATHAECQVQTQNLGRFKVELDWALGKKIAKARADNQNKDEHLDEDELTRLVMKMAAQVVPVEIVCPPLAFSALPDLERMLQPLREAGALGTMDSIFYAFGLHLNPELPDLESHTLWAYQQAFVIAQSWLIQKHEIDVSRRVTPYIDPWPKAYGQAVLQAESPPSLDEQIDLYLEHNNTRNRSLDLLPLFRQINEERLMAKVDDDRINARPTFHYRLPNCQIDETDWSLGDAWNLWSVVEYLAFDKDMRAQLSAQWLAYHSRLIQLEAEPWHEQLDQIHQNLLSV